VLRPGCALARRGGWSPDPRRLCRRPVVKIFRFLRKGADGTGAETCPCEIAGAVPEPGAGTWHVEATRQRRGTVLDSTDGHDLALLGGDTLRPCTGETQRRTLAKILKKRVYFLFSGLGLGVAKPCGTLTYRQAALGKRQRFRRFAALQQRRSERWDIAAGDRVLRQAGSPSGRVRSASDRGSCTRYAWHWRRDRLNSVCAECERAWLTT
jgi:hypothetical protein